MIEINYINQHYGTGRNRITFATYKPNSPKVIFPQVSDSSILDGKFPEKIGEKKTKKLLK